MFRPIVKEQDFLSSRKEYRQTRILQKHWLGVNVILPAEPCLRREAKEDHHSEAVLRG